MSPRPAQLLRLLASALALAAAACAVGSVREGAASLDGIVGDPGITTTAGSLSGTTGANTGGEVASSSTGGSTGGTTGAVVPAPVPTPIACPATVAPTRELVVTELAAVEDPLRTRWDGALADPADGAWQFGRLMAEMSGSQDPVVAASFVETWLRSFATTQSIDGFATTDSNSATETPDAPTPAGGKVFGAGDLLSVWPRTTAGALDLTQAPLLLLAVVNRIDQRDPANGKLGELRFVFQGEVCGAGGGLPNACAPGQTAFEARVILEYRVPTGVGFADATAWAAAWHALPDPAVAPAAYVAGLTALTHAVTAAGAAPGRPNNSAIGQVRTSQVNPATVPWVYRQFELVAAAAGQPAQLVGAPVGLTPDRRLNNGAALQQFLAANQSTIAAGVYSLPASLAAGGASGMSGGLQPNGTYTPDFLTTSEWGTGLGNTVDPTARYVFSLNTCNGCHGGETANNVSSAHILKRHVGQVSGLSTLFTGEGAGSGGPALPLPGARLGELERRQADMQAVLCHGAGATVGPLNVVPFAATH